MTIYMTCITIVIAIYLVSILVMEHQVGLNHLFNDCYDYIDNDSSDKEGKEAWDSVPESVRKGAVAALLLMIMPYLAVQLLMNK